MTRRQFRWTTVVLAVLLAAVLARRFRPEQPSDRREPGRTAGAGSSQRDAASAEIEPPDEGRPDRAGVGDVPAGGEGVAPVGPGGTSGSGVGAPSERPEGSGSGWPVGTVRGRVLDADGRPLPGIQVRWEAGELLDDRFADAVGSFEFDNAPLGSFDLVVWPPYGSPRLLEIRIPREGATVEVEIRLPRTTALEVVIDPPLDSSEIDLFPVADPAGPAGPFLMLPTSEEVEGRGAPWRDTLPEGPYDVVACAQDGVRLLWAEATVNVAGAEQRLEMSLQPMGRISGSVMDPSGRGTRARVHLLAAEERHLRLWGRVPVEGRIVRFPEGGEIHSDESGAFAVPALPPGEWRILALPEDARFRPSEALARVQPGEEARVTLSLEFGRTVTVRSPEGFEGFSWIVAWSPPGMRLSAADDHTLEILGLGPEERVTLAGTVVLGDRSYRADVAPGQVDVVLEQGSPATIEGVVLEADGNPAGAGVRVRLRSDYADLPWAVVLYPDSIGEGPMEGSFEAPFETGTWDDTGADGRFGPLHVPPGRWLVEVLGGESVSLGLGFGERSDLTLRLRP